MPVQVFWSLSNWVEAIAALAAEGTLPCRTVLVPRERVAHALRRELARTGRGELLAGTRFVTPPDLAAEFLAGSGARFRAGEEGLRPGRLGMLFRAGLHLLHFDPDQLRDVPGWPEAFARTILDLEGAGFRPDDLPPDASGRLADIAAIWRAADAAAGPSWTAQRILCEAAAVMESDTRQAAVAGPVLAALADDVTYAYARFCRAIPGVKRAVLGARPTRPESLRRIETLLGADARAAVESAAPPRTSCSERDVLASCLFESIDVLADPSRPRSRGPDGTVHLEEHSGVEAEVEAAVDWVARQIMAGTPLEEIAVLMPALDPVAGMLAERLARLPPSDGPMPVHVAGGLPLVGTAAGARALALLRAVQSHLALRDVADGLPSLRLRGDDLDRTHLSRARAMRCVAALGVVGGTPSDPNGALGWPTRLAQRIAALEEECAKKDGKSDDTREAGEARAAERLLADLVAIRPAVEGLTGAAAAILGEEPLEAIARRVVTFLKDFLLDPGPGARVWSVLKEALDDSLTDPLAGALSGPQALDWILSVLQGIRVSTVRFGAPAVYVGDVAGAAGLSFHAIRVMGLSEGTIPPSLAEDPVLPGSVRAELAPGRIPTPADRALFAVRALDRAVRTASCSVVLSAPRTDLGRVQREPSSSLLEAAAALGRPDTATGSPAAVIPDMRRLRRDSFVPARRDARAARWTAPVSDASWIDRAATTGHAGTVPPAWLAAPSLDIARMRTLSSPAATGPVAGFLDRGRPLPDVPGLSATAPISASGLRRLLQCPYGFLLERVLRFEEPEEADLLREIDALSYGSLLHEVAAAFYRAHGSEFCARHHDLPHWERHASALAAQAFDAFVRWYPLAGKEISASERRRLERDVARLLAHDWGDGLPTRNHGVEVAFGYDREVTVEGDGGERLHVRGYIDRIDVEGDRTVVRDIKTGKPKPRAGRQAAPDPITDVQIALYGMVVRQHAAEWSLPGDTGAVYVYLAGMRGSERAFVDDWATLESRARAWVGVAARLLRDRAFPRSPEGDDCCYCAFGAVCGGDAAARSAAMLASAGEPGSSFLGIRTGEDDGEDA